MTIDLAGLEERARGCIAEQVSFDYVAGGAGDEITLLENVAAWRQLRLRPRMLRDVSNVSTETTVLGTTIHSPVLIAPTAMHGLVSPERELATARGAARSGTIYILSMAATASLEEVAAAAPEGPRWMQLYIQADHGLTRDACARAREAGYGALVVTVDSPVTTKRSRFEASEFHVPEGMTLPNLAPRSDVTPDIFELVAAYDSALTFDDLAGIKEWGGGLPLVVKGILRGDDAADCLDAGADAIAVSNHGGRQVDTCIPTADALRDVVDTIGDRAEVYVDGGIRGGADVLKALALGARAVLVGRQVVWGLAVGGAEGVDAVLNEFLSELKIAMGLCGVNDVNAVPADLLAPPRH
jgi:4-hydroxymandelate oxidase